MSGLSSGNPASRDVGTFLMPVSLTMSGPSLSLGRKCSVASNGASGVRLFLVEQARAENRSFPAPVSHLHF